MSGRCWLGMSGEEFLTAWDGDRLEGLDAGDVRDRDCGDLANICLENSLAPQLPHTRACQPGR